MTPRLASKLLASALGRSVESAGGFGMILAKGDAEAGAILIVALEKGQITGLYERQMAADMRYVWTGIGPQALDNKAEIDEFVERRRARDPDLWVIELDIPNAPQFIAEFDTLA